MGKNTYIDSPLGVGLDNLLQGIAALKQKYAHDNSAGKALALKQIQAIETVVKTLHKDVLPQFDDQKKPGLLGIVNSLKDFRKYKELFYTRRYKLYDNVKRELESILKSVSSIKDADKAKNIINELEKRKQTLCATAMEIPGESIDELFTLITATVSASTSFKKDELAKSLKYALIEKKSQEADIAISHPMMVEFIELLITLRSNAPDELKDLAPFFNPEAIGADFNGGFLGPIIRGITGKGYKLENIPGTFKYDFTIFPKSEEPFVKTFSLEKRYHALSGLIEKRMVKKIGRFFQENPTLPFVERQRQRSDLFTQFGLLEAKQVSELRSEFFRSNPELEPERYSDPVKTLESINKAKINREAILAALTEQQKLLEIKAENYSQLTISQLLQPYPELLKRFEQNGIDLTVRLPHFIFTSGEDAVPILYLQKAFCHAIKIESTSLRRYKEALEWKIKRYESEQETLITTWQEKQTSALQDSLIKLNALKQPQGELSKDVDNIEVLKQVLHNNAQWLQKLKPIQQEIELVERTAAQESQLLTESFPSGKESIQKALGTITKNCRMWLSDIEMLEQSQYKESREIESRLHKAQTQADFAKNMEAANPELISRMLKDIGQKELELDKEVQKLNKTIEALEEKTQAEQKELELTSQQLKQAEFQHHQTIETMRAGLSALSTKVAMYQLLPEQDIRFGNDKELDLFIANLRDEVSKYPLNHLPLSSNEELIATLSQVEKLLTSSENTAKKLIPFTSIDALLGGKEKGFITLTSMLGLKDKEGLTWKEYRSKQDDVFTFKPSAEEYKKKFNLLLASIRKAKACLEIRLDLPTVEEDIRKEKAVQSELGRFRAIEKQSAHALEHHRREYTEKFQTKENLDREKNEAATDIVILNSILYIIERVQGYRSLLESLVSSTQLSLADEQLYHNISTIQDSREALAQEMKQLSEEVSHSSKSSTYEKNIENLNQLIQSIDQNFVDVIAAKTDITSLKTRINSFNKEIAAVLEAPITPELFPSVFERFQSLNSKIVEHSEWVEKCQIAAKLTENTQITQNFAELALLQTGLLENHQQLNNFIYSQMQLVLKEQKIRARVFEDTGNQESLEAQKELDTRLQHAFKLFKEMPGDDKLDETNRRTPITHLSTIKILRHELEIQLDSSREILNELSQRIASRDIGVENLLQEIKSYLDARVPHSKHNKNQQYFEDLRQAIIAYKASGNAQNLLVFVEENKPLANDLHAQAIVHRVSADILDLNAEIPEDYNRLKDPGADPGNLHAEAQKLLEEKEKSHKNYAEAINRLYQLVEEMATKWPQTEELASKLQLNIDQFVVKHPKELPNQEDYNAFKHHFTARLHSQDHLLSEHRTAWKNHLANIAIGFITLGIALGVKLLVSKVTEGRYSLFFDKTKRQEQAEKIEETIKNNLVPPIA